MSDIRHLFPLHARVRTTEHSHLATGLEGKVFEYWEGQVGVRLDSNGACYWFSIPKHLDLLTTPAEEGAFARRVLARVESEKAAQSPNAVRRAAGLPEADVVKQPAHYRAHPSGVECIEIVAHMGFAVGAAIKYLWRADEKHDDGGVEDLRKARQFIDFEIATRTSGNPLDCFK